ncbi:MAG: PLD nuclease N-terminal domain-containing protein [Armatimonadota bacterium]
MAELIGGTLLLMVILGIATLALIVWALVDLFSRPMDTGYRLLWVAVILLLPVVGSIAYLIVGRTTRGTAI